MSGLVNTQLPEPPLLYQSGASLELQQLISWAHDFTGVLQLGLTQGNLGGGGGDVTLPIYDAAGRVIVDLDGLYGYDPDGTPWMQPGVVVIDTSKLADAAVVTSKLADQAVDHEKLAALAVEAENLANGSVVAGKIAVNTIVAGDGVIANAAIGTALIADAAITTALIGDAQIVTAKIADLAVNTAKIADLSVSSAKIANLAVGSAKIGDLAVTAAKIADATITTAKIANAAISTALIQNAAITTALIADAAILSAKIADAAILSAKIADAAITQAKIADLAVNAAKIANAAISTAKIQNAAVDTLQLAGRAVTFPVGSYTAATGSTTALGETTIQSVSFTGDGQPVFVDISLFWGYNKPTSGAGEMRLLLYNNGTQHRNNLLATSTNAGHYASGITFNSVNGTNNVQLRVSRSGQSATLSYGDRSLFAILVKR